QGPARRAWRGALSDRGGGHAEVPVPAGAGGPRLPRCEEAGAAEGSGGVVKPIEAVNDFVIKFANVNGSGSASANELFAKAILRLAVVTQCGTG
ncbi:hypothetical protein B4Q13_19320, partial [Lacticaseibacillus rhamnosus]